MPRPPIEPRWVERVRQMRADNEKWSAEKIARELGQEGDPTSPSGRAVRRILATFDSMSPQGRREYARFRWPESMESGAVPWEASRALLDLQGQHPAPGRIPNRVARWYWRATQAMPGAGINERLRVAGSLAAMEALGRRPDANMEPLRRYLALAPWGSEEASAAYDGAIESGRVARYDGTISATFDDDLGELTRNLLGLDFPGLDQVGALIVKRSSLSERKGRSE